MAFIVKQRIYGKDYYYLRKSVREGNKVRSKMIAYLGKDKKEAEEKAKNILSGMEKIKRNNKQDDREHKSRKMKKEEKDWLEHKKISIDELANFCKRKGFVFRSSDIYGGFAGFWDFGPLGVELFNNIKRDWWNHFVQQKENMIGIEASIISHPLTWKASGHIENFKDIAVQCKKCKKSTKVDPQEFGKIKCECGGDYEKLGEFNILFKTSVGALSSEDAYLRGETAQGMFLNFRLIAQTSRMQLPFGVAQIGRCFRNEIAPRDFLFRSREFHIGEFEFFLKPEENKCEFLTKEHLNLEFDFLDSEIQKKGSEELKKVLMKDLLEKKKLEEWHAYWLAEQIMWFKSLGLEEIKIREHTKDELSHYSSATFDIDYEYPFGSKEVAGNANRGQYDLTQHEKMSKQSMTIFDEKSGKNIVPKVIEPTFGMERVFLALLTKGYTHNKKGETVLRLPKKIAPIKAAIFPIVKKPEFEKISRKVYDLLKDEWNVIQDKSGSIGRRYARNDEIGTPYCITIDGDSAKNKDVTIRDRDTTKQIRVKIDCLKEVLRELINGDVEFEKAGKLLK